VHTIQPASALPEVTDPVIIDGYTQPGSSPNTLAKGDNATLEIELDGSSLNPDSGIIGLLISAGGSTVRGLVINRFPDAGIELSGNGGNVIEGNFIGTDVTGTTALGNFRAGVYQDSHGNQVGGTTPDARNVISGNNGDGVFIADSATGNVVQGNFLGTDASGRGHLGNEDSGVFITIASGNTVGGTTPGAGNILSGNGFFGVNLGGDGNQVEGNFIGTDSTGANALGNGLGGVQINASSNTIGGTDASAGNTIAFNSGPGVDVFGGTGNGVLGNAIFANTALGILLSPGANQMQMAPDLTEATAAGGSTTVGGTLQSAPNTTFRVEVFINVTPDPSGFGQGQTFLGFTSATTDASGNASFTATFQTPVSLGSLLSATATDPGNNTSEFSGDININGLTITSFSQSTFQEGAPGFTLTVGGTKFTGASTVEWHSQPLTTTFVSSTEVQALIPQSLLAEEGSAYVTVSDPALGIAVGRSFAITDAPLTLFAGSFQPIAGTLFSGPVATFTDMGGVEPAGNYLAMINWGDGGTSVPGTVTSNGMASFSIAGQHTYTSVGMFTVSVTIQDDAYIHNGGSTASRMFTVLTGCTGTPNQVFVTQLYFDLLARQPASAEVTFWSGALDAGVSRQDVILGFEASLEFRQHEVIILYQHYLKRAPDRSGLSAFAAFLAAGGTLDQAAFSIVTSPEYFQNRGSGTNSGWLSALYQDALSRAIDPTGAATWGAVLSGGGSLGQVAAGIFGSPEYARHAVDLYYQDFLRRHADGPGLTFWTKLLLPSLSGSRDEEEPHLTSEGVIGGLVGSEEYYLDVQTSCPIIPFTPQDWLTPSL
jgi:hypothetical protein